MPTNNPQERQDPIWWTVEHTVIWVAVEPRLREDFEQRRAERHRSQVKNQGADDAVYQREPSTPRNVEIGRAHQVPDEDWETGEDDWDEVRSAMKYGVGARKQYPDVTGWNDDIASRLKDDWSKSYEPSTWERVKRFVKRGFEHRSESK